MKVEKAQWKDDTFGINLTSEDEEEEQILRRFWDAGIKINRVTMRGAKGSTLQLTFLDEMNKPKGSNLEEMVDALFKVGGLGYGNAVYGVLKTLAYEIDQLKRRRNYDQM